MPNKFSLSQKKQLIKDLYPKRTKENALKSFLEIDDMTEKEFKQTPPLSIKGSVAVQYFTDLERFDTAGNKGVSFFDVYYPPNREQIKKRNYINKFIEWSKKNRQENILQIWKGIFQVYFGLPTIFKPLLAMDYYLRFKPNSVLDFTMGWGGRLLGAAALDVPNYIGIDLNHKLKKPYEEMVKMIKPYTKTKITLMFRDALSVDYSKLNYDMVLTSPPYYNIEIYEGTQRQSKEEWDEKFYKPIIEKTWAGLKKGGHYCLNIPVEVYDRVAIKVLGGANMKIPLVKVQRKKGGGQNYKEFTYVWVK